MSDFNTALENKIEAFYKNKSGNSLGWRLLSSPCDTMLKSKIAFIGMNPGGDKDVKEHPKFCMPIGQSAYRDEIWDNNPKGESKLQKQVLELFKMLRCEPQEVLSGNFVPFRSSSWKELNNQQECLAFSRNIWREIFGLSKPNLIIVMGNEIFDELYNFLNCNTLEKFLVNWGNISSEKARFAGGTLIRLPHLSRFTIMTKKDSHEALRQLFKEFLPIKLTEKA